MRFVAARLLAQPARCLLWGLSIGTMACGPSYQPEPSPKQPAQQEAPREPARFDDTEPMARTPVPSDGPLVQRQPASGTQPRPDATGVRETPSASALDARFQAILDRHNAHRAEHCAAPLRWSSELQAHAQDWANQLRDAGCAFEHRPNNRFGENLSFFAPVGSRSPEDIATGWYSEVSQYDFGRGDFDFHTGHFTQLVWRDTQAIGCGLSRCNGGEIWVCNYDPPGNMIGSFRSQVLPASCRK